MKRNVLLGLLGLTMLAQMNFAAASAQTGQESDARAA